MPATGRTPIPHWLVSVDAADYGAGPLAGMAFQRKLERGAFLLGGSDYRAPAQSVKSFLEGSAPDLSKASVTPTYSCGVEGGCAAGAVPSAGQPDAGGGPAAV